MDEDLWKLVRFRVIGEERRWNRVRAVVFMAGKITRLVGRSGLVDSRGRILAVGMMPLQEGSECFHVGQLAVQGIE